MTYEKELSIVTETKGPNAGLFKIQWSGGGELPKVLKGHWTTEKLAKERIRGFQSTVQDKVKNSRKGSANAA